jgi:formylglycine-generating enzyme
MSMKPHGYSARASGRTTASRMRYDDQVMRGVILVGLTTLACGSSGSSSRSGSEDSGGEAGGGAGGTTVTGGSGASSTGGSAGATSGGIGGSSGAAGGQGGSNAGTGGTSGTAGTAGTGGSAGNGDCKARVGPALVDVGDFCIDTTEVTYALYQIFLDDIEGTTPEQPTACSWNDSFVPATLLANGESTNLPVRGVDWCDAYVFCAWSGKRLCGRPGGGPASYDEPSYEEESQWYSACSAGGVNFFPYGDAYDEQACNGGDYGDAEMGPLPVGSVTTCSGGYPGIYDMSGNVWEWEDSCNASTGEMDLCRARGGAFANGGDLHRCDYSGFSPTRNFNAGPTGIRCCDE